MKIWYTVTLKDYENLVCCNLAAMLHIQQHINNSSIRCKYRSETGNEIILEQSLKSYNSIKIWCTITSKLYALHHLIV